MGIDSSYGKPAKKPAAVVSAASKKAKAASASLRANNIRKVSNVYGPIINPELPIYRIQRNLPGKNGSIFAKPDSKYDFLSQTPSRNGSRFNRNEQWWLGAMRGFTGREPQGPFRYPDSKLPWGEKLTGGTGRRTLSGSEADRRWSQSKTAYGKIGVKTNLDWMQSTSGGIRRSEPGFFTARGIDTRVLKGKTTIKNKKTK